MLCRELPCASKEAVEASYLGGNKIAEIELAEVDISVRLEHFHCLGPLQGQ